MTGCGVLELDVYSLSLIYLTLPVTCKHLIHPSQQDNESNEFTGVYTGCPAKHDSW